MSWGIPEVFGSIATLLFALPLALAGAELLVGGNIFVGVGLLCVAVAMIVVERYVTSPSDLPEKAAKKAFNSVISPPDEE